MTNLFHVNDVIFKLRTFCSTNLLTDILKTQSTESMMYSELRVQTPDSNSLVVSVLD